MPYADLTIKQETIKLHFPVLIKTKKHPENLVLKRNYKHILIFSNNFYPGG